MKVSIMITCYNLEDYIGVAIQSVVSQQMPFDWELLIGDDGSSDSSMKVINEWKDKYSDHIKVFVMPRDSSCEKSGTRAAQNRANLLEQSTGEYLIFLDGDDRFIENTKILKQVSLLDDPKYSLCSCCAHNTLGKYVQLNKNDLLCKDHYGTRVFSPQYYWRNLYFHPDTILFRNNAKDLMLTEPYRDYLNDNFITYIILQFGSVVYIDEIMSEYNITGNGLWTGKDLSYGCFRNIMLCDLEVFLNPCFRHASFIRHLSDINHLQKCYKGGKPNKIDELMANADPELFKLSWILYKTDGLLFRDKLKRASLFLKKDFFLTLRRFRNMCKKIRNRFLISILFLL